jgi:hypothetical protein
MDSSNIKMMESTSTNIKIGEISFWTFVVMGIIGVILGVISLICYGFRETEKKNMNANITAEEKNKNIEKYDSIFTGTGISSLVSLFISAIGLVVFLVIKNKK